MYQQEHNELFASIRTGKPINDGEWMAHSTLMGIMGRMAAYTGQEVTWEQAMNSQEKLVPDQLDWNMKLDIAPMAMPGVTKLSLIVDTHTYESSRISKVGGGALALAALAPAALRPTRNSRHRRRPETHHQEGHHVGHRGRERLGAGEDEGRQGRRLRGHGDDEPHGPG